MTIELDLQLASSCDAVPGAEDFETWLAPALKSHGDVGLAIRIVDTEEMRALNSRYRGHDKATNVLSFPADLPEVLRGEIKPEPLGDIVICAPAVQAEADAQGKPLFDHWAHLTIHGLLHLLGHDHQRESEAEAMEALETAILAGLGIPDPYSR